VSETAILTGTAAATGAPAPAVRPAARTAVSARRVPALTGLRCVIVFVLAEHYLGVVGYPHGLLENIYHAGADVFGAIGLDIFFALSGFLITGILIDSKGARSFFRTFYARRVLRIVPPYYGMLIVLFVLAPAVVPGLRPEFAVSPLQRLYYWGYLSNIGVAVSGWQVLLPYMQHIWSLALEEQFYLIWPLVVFLCSRRRLKLVCGLMLATAPVFRVVIWFLENRHAAGWVLVPSRMDTIAMGALIAILVREPAGLARFARPAGRIAGAALLVILSVFLVGRHYHPDGKYVQLVGLTASAYLAGGILVACLTARHDRWWYRALSSTPFVRLGEYSYVIYLVHFPMTRALTLAGFPPERFGVWFATRLGAMLARAAVLAALSIGTAALSWHLIERPLLTLKKYLPYHYPDERTASA
jgi:peptidoglycan/LPS O-acetylase OafA/YrhL